MGINYYDIMEKLNTSYRIAGLETEGEKLSNPGTTKLSYIKAVRMVSGHNKAISNHPPQ